MTSPKYPGTRVTTNGNQLVAFYTEPLVAEAGVFYPITPSTEQGENFQLQYAKGQLNAFGDSFIAIEAEGEHAAMGGAIAVSVTGKRTVNFTSGQGIVYGVEQYYHAPGKLSTMVLQVGARALTKHALNVHCAHDDIYATLDTGWLMCFAKDAQQASDQALILRKVTEATLTPGMNIQDGFLTTHLERTFRRPEPGLVREFLGHPNDQIECPTPAQKELFGETRRRVPEVLSLKAPQLLGPVQNQEHYMNGIAARRNNFSEGVLGFFEQAYEEFAELTGREYGLISQYRCDDAETVFIALGSAAENIEAGVDHLRNKGEKAGVIHVNVIRPFPEDAIVKAVKGKKRVIVLERTDESLSGDNPLTRDIRVAISKACENKKSNRHAGLSAIDPATEKPEIYSGVYGLGSRDFRPEGILGAYEYATGQIARQDGKKATDGEAFFYVGIDHPYAVISDDVRSFLPEGSIAVRLHSIGGWGMITTGKNLGEILGTFSNMVAERDDLREDDGTLKEIVNISANPKYGSEKKGAPTNYFMVAAPERIRMNCDLRHVNVVLCCDPKIFLHSNPLDGLREGGAFVWESSESPDVAWQRIPPQYRQEIVDKNIKVYTLAGFNIAKEATDRPELQTRMQGNAFLGAFFKVSSFLGDYKITEENFASTVRAQYVKKFGRFGDAVVDSNMKVMEDGFSTLQEVAYGKLDAADRSSFVSGSICPTTSGCDTSIVEQPRPNIQKSSYFDSEYRAGYGYNQPASALAAVGNVASGNTENVSKYVARREVPIWVSENCTQCMDCISICPDTALPNSAQEITTVIRTAVQNYVGDDAAREVLLKHVIPASALARDAMKASVAEKAGTSFAEIAMNALTKSAEGDSAVSKEALAAVETILGKTKWAYQRTMSIFSLLEKKEEGAGGIFSISVNDKCKGCGECVDVCGDDAIYMATETEEIHADMETSEGFHKLLADTPQKFLGMFDAENPAETRAAALRYHLMLRSKYTSFLAGDGGCAGCGEKSVLRGIATVTETLMRPMFHAKADRLTAKAKQLKETGLKSLESFKAADEAGYEAYKRTVLHVLCGLGGSDTADTDVRLADWNGSDADLVDAVVAVLTQDAFNHRDLQTIEGTLANGMCAMAMTAHTGCNSVYGSTPPNNPHPYPWMNSLFQDGVTIGWLVAESFIQNHGSRSVIPERLADSLLASFAEGYTAEDYFTYTHFSDMYMTDLEINELPKIWAVGGDGGMGDIGFQNMSKVVLQNRPNVNILMLDTQVYSNTGGQNSDSSVMTGGFDMNQIGPATEGKLTEKKSVSEIFMNGHGSPFVAQVSMANSANFYKAVIDGLCYRGTCYVQAYTTCQPEHGVADDASQAQAMLARDSRCMPEFVFNSGLGETYGEALSLKGNAQGKNDWMTKKIPGTKEKYNYTTAHWAFTEARFRNHHKIIKDGNVDGLLELNELMKNITQDDVVNRRFLDKTHRAYIPNKGVYAIDYKADGTPVYHLITRQMVLFCIERRKAWRMLQSRAGVTNADYEAQKEYLKSL